MATDKLGNTLHVLESLLEQEHDFLTKGDLDRAFRLAPRKQRLLDHTAMARSAPTRDHALSARRVREKAIRNGRLITAAIEGVRAAMSEIEELHRGPMPLKTYGRDGQCRALGENHDEPRLEHKA